MAAKFSGCVQRVSRAGLFSAFSGKCARNQHERLNTGVNAVLQVVFERILGFQIVAMQAAESCIDGFCVRLRPAVRRYLQRPAEFRKMRRQVIVQALFVGPVSHQAAFKPGAVRETEKIRIVMAQNAEPFEIRPPTAAPSIALFCSGISFFGQGPRYTSENAASSKTLSACRAERCREQNSARQERCRIALRHNPK